MNHIINPISFRLGVSRFWNSTWATTVPANYSYINFNIRKIEHLFRRYFEPSFLRKRSSLLMSNIKYFASSSYFYLFVYLKLQKNSRFLENIHYNFFKLSVFFIRKICKLFSHIFALQNRFISLSTKVSKNFFKNRNFRSKVKRSHLSQLSLVPKKPKKNNNSFFRGRSALPHFRLRGLRRSKIRVKLHYLARRSFPFPIRASVKIRNRIPKGISKDLLSKKFFSTTQPTIQRKHSKLYYKNLFLFCQSFSNFFNYETRKLSVVSTDLPVWQYSHVPNFRISNFTEYGRLNVLSRIARLFDFYPQTRWTIKLPALRFISLKSRVSALHIFTANNSPISSFAYMLPYFYFFYGNSKAFHLFSRIPKSRYRGVAPKLLKSFLYQPKPEKRVFLTYKNIVKLKSNSFFNNIWSSLYLSLQILHFKHFYNFSSVKTRMKLDFQKLFRIPDVKVFFILQYYDHFSALFLSRYIRIKLLHKYPVNNLVYNILNMLKRGIFSGDLSGFQFIFSGRFTRKQRAFYIVKHEGRNSLSSRTALVDYSLSQVILLNSICGIKVWLTRNSSFPGVSFII